MKKIIRDNDQSDHGGYIIASAGRFKNRGIKTAVHGDMHVCPIRGHGTTSVTATSRSFRVGSVRVVVEGDQAQCGAAMIASNTDVKTN